ncbi:hypothetical protein ACFLT2_02265 [Acidobacteriota bacterium]
MSVIKNPKKLQKFENALIRKGDTNPSINFQLVEAMYIEALSLGIFPLKNKLDGIEVDLRIAKVVNSVS